MCKILQADQRGRDERLGESTADKQMWESQGQEQPLVQNESGFFIMPYTWPDRPLPTYPPDLPPVLEVFLGFP